MGNAARTFEFLDPNENGILDGSHELGQLFFGFDPEPDALNEDLIHSFADEDVKELVETVISDSWSFPDLRP